MNKRPLSRFPKPAGHAGLTGTATLARRARVLRHPDVLPTPAMADPMTAGIDARAIAITAAARTEGGSKPTSWARPSLQARQGNAATTSASL